MGAPLFVLNLKTYPQALGGGAVALARLLELAARRLAVAAAIAPSAPDIGSVAAAQSLPVLAQHLDGVPSGQTTGFVVAESVRASGGRGSLLNHSEHPITASEVRRSLLRLKELGLTGVVCAKDSGTASELARFRPPYLAVEPPELIGTGISVSTARPEVVSDSVRAVAAVSPSTRVLCGAGITRGRDVVRALQLGAQGVLVASAIAQAQDPKAAIEDLLSGLCAADSRS